MFPIKNLPIESESTMIQKTIINESNASIIEAIEQVYPNSQQ